MNALLPLITTIILNASVPKEPVLRSQEGHYLAINPLASKVELTITCSGDYEPVLLEMLPRTQQELEIKQPNGFAASCLLDSYRRVK